MTETNGERSSDLRDWDETDGERSSDLRDRDETDGERSSDLRDWDDRAELEWVLAAAAAADDKLAGDIVIIDVGAVLAITDHFLIASGRNARQVRAIAEEIEEQLTLLGGPDPLRVEGRDEYQWLLMDYGDFIVHVFDGATREYYDLERLWSDQPRVPWAPSAPASRTGDRSRRG